MNSISEKDKSLFYRLIYGAYMAGIIILAIQDYQAGNYYFVFLELAAIVLGAIALYITESLVAYESYLSAMKQKGIRHESGRISRKYQDH